MFSQAWIIQTLLRRGHFLRESPRLPPRASGGRQEHDAKLKHLVVDFIINSSPEERKKKVVVFC